MFCSKCGTKINDDSVFCSKCGSKIQKEAESPIIPTSDQSLQPSTSAIREYLHHAKSLEMNRYTLNTAINRLQQKINSLGRAKHFSMPEPKTGVFLHAFWPAFLVLLVLGIVISAFVCGDEPGSVLANIVSMIIVVLIFFNTDLLIGFGISLGVAIVGGILFGIASVANERSAYKYKLDEYNSKVDADQKRVAKEKEQIRSLKSQQAELYSEISNIESIMKEFYSLDIIYPKYRELVPIVTMHEYFEARRCFDLEGPSGAYNLYEAETRQNIIISSLHQVISMLAQIQRNQRALYDAIQESNSIAERIYRQSESMLATNKAIARNSEIAAYNSKIAADNSAISAYISISRY